MIIDDTSIQAASASPTISIAQDRAPAATVRPKLRDSCHACASSKVKCQREKPTCCRCRERGLKCEYLAHRRSGRRKGIYKKSGTATLENVTPSSPIEQSWPTLDFWTHDDAQLSNLGMNHDYYPSPDSFDHSPTSFGMGFNDPVTIPLAFPLVSPPSIGLTSPTTPSSTTDQSSPNTGGFPDLTAVFSELWEDHWSTLEGNQIYLAANQQHDELLHTTSNSTSCLTRAFDLLTQLSTTTSRSCRACDAQPYVWGGNRPVTLSAVIAENRRVLHELSEILQCECSHDDDILTIQAMIVSKVMDSYTSVFHADPGACEDDLILPYPLSWRQPPLFDACPRSQQPYSKALLTGVREPLHIAAQSVLGELHRVQRLVAQMSERSKRIATGQDGSQVYNKSRAADKPPHLSSIPFGPVEANLRKKLGSLSLESINLLQQSGSPKR
ncbi:hypothetical protein BKA67DRAFT_657790 [Truncatella angustata]|uniref:Zn(2)-C6 fungal-type domain-containing protein n=1 Tax=Truncatella angustata TaxID=152316 RepID=A0A9P8UPE7_9PEZI|nr:uncharacterized protein BKA67DRAFT_657790 [Truncatella angustata]KAH6655890.1 hypothetical protein BKA67DRAFT_657790 [Truncatella angustata]